MEVQRLPYVTIGIVAVCIFVHMITHFAAAPDQKRLIAAEQELVEYYLNYPSLELSEKVRKKLSPEASQMIAQIDKFNEIMQTTVAEVDDELQEELNERIRDFEEALSSDYFRKYGYIPAEGGIVKIFTSMFIHGGFLHLLGNMLFLWLAGCAIEDLWGRIIFPVFYLLGGVIAAWAHAFMYPISTIACVGASGAIAAAMGAFMIRLYNTRIRFVYAYFLGIRFRRGSFIAPAYFMLPLWLLVQLWWGFIYSGQQEAGGVAFWAHIGGFVYGAAVALLFMATGLEKRIIAPSVEKKSNLLDENFSAGMAKLEAGDPEGAIADFRKILINNPEDAAARGELCRAYIQTGKIKLASQEFKRSVRLLMDRGMMNEAIDEFLELTESQPEFALEPEKELALIAEMVERRKFVEAVGAYERFYELCRKDPEMQSRPFAVNALMRCGDVFMQHLDQPKEAFLSYRKMLQSEFELTDIQKKRIIEKAKDAKQMAMERSNAASLDIGNGQPQRHKVSHNADAESLNRVASIPLQERIRLIQPTKKPPRYPLGSIAPWEAGSVIPVPGGMDVRLGSHEPLRYDNIFLICAFDLLSDPSNEILADIFLGQSQRPYRIFSSRINYSRFLSKLSTNNLDNFRSFILHLIGRINSVFLDRDTLVFLKTRKIKKFSKDEEALTFQKNLWQQIIGMVRSQCEKCGKARWVDGRKIPPEGVRIKCLSCAHSFDLNGENFNKSLAKQ